MPDSFLESGSLVLVFLALALAGLGLPIPEEIVLMTVGALIHRGAVRPAPALLVAAAGVLSGDTLLFVAARRVGDAALRRSWVGRLLPPSRRARLERLFRSSSGRVIFFARQIGVLRAPVFALAAIQRFPMRRFLSWDALGLCLSLPLSVGLGWLGSNHLQRILDGFGHVEHYLVVGLLVGLAGFLAVRSIRAGSTA